MKIEFKQSETFTFPEQTLPNGNKYKSITVRCPSFQDRMQSTKGLSNPPKIEELQRAQLALGSILTGVPSEDLVLLPGVVVDAVLGFIDGSSA